MGLPLAWLGAKGKFINKTCVSYLKQVYTLIIMLYLITIIAVRDFYYYSSSCCYELL